MAKKDKKKSKKKDNAGADAVGAVRTAVERTFHATADRRRSPRATRAQDLVDEVAGAAGRLREMVDQLSVLEDIKKQVEALASRVAALERGGGVGEARGDDEPQAGREPQARRRSRKRARDRARRRAARKTGGVEARVAARRREGRRRTATKPAAKRPATSTPSLPPGSPPRSSPDGRSRVRLRQGVPRGHRPSLHDDERGPRDGARSCATPTCRSASSSTTSTWSSTSAPATGEEGNLHWEWTDDVDWEPKVKMAMSSETANKYFQGKENVASRSRAGGSRPAATSRRRSALIPITKPVYARYRAFVEARVPAPRSLTAVGV